MQPDRGLIHRDADEKSLGFIWGIRSLRAGDDDAHFPVWPQSNRQHADVPPAKWIRDSRRPLRWAVCQPDAERFTDLFRPGRDTTGRGQSDHLDWRPIDRLAQPSVGEVEVQHPEQNVEQGATNVGRRATAPDGRKGYETDEIVDTPSEVFDLIVGISELRCHRPAPARS